MTGYDLHLSETAGKVAASDAYLAIKGKVLNSIRDAYPDLVFGVLQASRGGSFGGRLSALVGSAAAAGSVAPRASSWQEEYLGGQFGGGSSHL